MSRSTVLLALLVPAAALPAAAENYILRTDPPVAGASVFVDGTFAGSTDDNGKVLVSGTPGRHEIRVDYQSETYIEQMDFDADLNALPPFPIVKPKPQPEADPNALVDYMIDTNVAGATIFVDGELRGTTDTAGRAALRLLPRRPFPIEIRKNGFETRTLTITVPATGGQLSVE